MWERATLTIVVSRTSMKVAMVTTSAISQGFRAGRTASPLTIAAAPPGALIVSSPSRSASHPSSSCSTHPDLRADRHPRRQEGTGVVRPVEDDLYREALHHLHDNPGGIFGW